MLRRPKQETLDQIEELRPRTSLNRAAAAGDVSRIKVDENDNKGRVAVDICPDEIGSSLDPHLGFELSLIDYIRPPCPERKLNLPHIETKLELNLKGISRPIGMTVLVSGNLVVGDRAKDVVIMYDSNGKFVKEIRPGRPFKRPSDMVTLPDGRFAVRDNNGLQMFDEEGAFMRTVVPKGVLGMCFGLATDGKGHLMTINTNKRGEAACMTKKNETDILVIAVESGQIVEQIQLVDVIADSRKSSCRFLHCDGKKLYVSDLGLNVVYVMRNVVGPKSVKSFGKRGKGIGEFTDVAGIAADSDGSLLIVDACNNRIQVFNKQRKFIGMVRIPKEAPLKRPSGILLDTENRVIYVLNLWSNSLSKFSLVEP